MAEEALVQVEQRGRVRVVTLNRPHVLNALNAPLETALVAALDQADQDPDTLAVVLRGNGRAFSAGADLKERADSESMDVDQIVNDYRLNSAFVRMIEMETPV